MTKGQEGFTLIEIMVVLVIISIIAVLIVPNILSRPDEARAVVVKSDIQAISNALELYKLDNYTYPGTDQGLEALVTKPESPPEPEHWKTGGYLSKVPVDPWGNPYQYLCPGVHGAYDLWSLGSKGKQGGGNSDKDIIGNWE